VRLVECARNGHWRAHWLFAPMLAFFLLAVAQWAFRWSIYPGATLTGVIQLAGCGCAFWLAWSGMTRRSLRRAAWAMWLFTGCLSLIAIAQSLSSFPSYIYGFHRADWASPVGPFVYHNHFAGCMDLLLPIAVAVSIRPARGGEAAWSRWLRRGTVPAVGLVAMVLSLSRGGILTLGLESLLAVAVFWRELRQRAWVLVLGAAFMLGFATLTQWHAMLQRFETLHAQTPGLVERLRVAQSCWNIFLHYPGLGTGFNTFASVYPAFQTFDTGQIWTAAHNDYAQILAEMGLAGAACVLSVLVIAFLCVRRQRRLSALGAEVRGLQLAAAIGAAGFLFHSYGDFQFQNPANAILFFLSLAMATFPLSPPVALPRRMPDAMLGRRLEPSPTP